MKKFIALVVMLCAVLISSTASAVANWVWVYSDDEITIYVDNNSFAAIMITADMSSVFLLNGCTVM